MRFRLVVMAAGLLAAGAVQAGQYTDDLSKCLVGKSTMDDHLVLIQWIYAALSRNPAVASMGTVSDVQVDKANQRMAELFTRLLTVTCKDQAKLALKFEGDFAMQQSFQQLGLIAGRDMFASPDVQKGMSGLTKYIDPKMMAELKSP